MLKKSYVLFIGVLALLFVACKDSATKDTNASTDVSSSKTLSDVEIGLRKTSLESENSVVLPNAVYESAMPGESELIQRSFENAPPLISHSIEGMLPLSPDNNICLTCHDKALAADINATAMPATHYFDFINNKSTGDVVSNARFSCTQCHVVQSDAKPIVGNTFKADFQNETLKNKSNLIDTLNEGIK